MNVKSIKSVVLVLVGALAGCGAGATVVASFAAPAVGKWQCYDSQALPDLAAAATSWFAEDLTKGMNLAADHAPAGETIVVPQGTGGNSKTYLCVKH
jgi:hypothetical protein